MQEKPKSGLERGQEPGRTASRVSGPGCRDHDDAGGNKAGRWAPVRSSAATQPARTQRGQGGQRTRVSGLRSPHNLRSDSVRGVRKQGSGPTAHPQVCDLSKRANLGPGVQRVNKSGSCAGEENDGAGLCDASAMSRRGDRRVAFRRTDWTQGPWAREGQAGQDGERACAQPGSVPGERKASEKQRATAVRTRAAGWTAARSRRSRRKTLLCTARSEREKGRSKVSKKSLKRLLEDGREMTREACKSAQCRPVETH